MEDSEIVERVKQSLRLCAGFENDQESADREKAQDYYFMRPRGDEVAGRSKVVSGDLSAMVEAVLSQMMDALSTTRICEFDSYDLADDDQATLESDAVEWFVMKRQNGIMVFQVAIKDALLLRNGVVKVWCEEHTEIETRTLRNVLPEALGELTNVPGAEVELLSYDQDKRTAVLRFTRGFELLRVEAVAIENFVYLDGWHTHDLQRIPICGERHVSTRSEMIDDHGFEREQVLRLPAYRHEYKADATARDTQKHQYDRSPLDASQEPIEWYELYVLMDLDGDGVSERHEIDITGKGDELLGREERRLVPYAVGAAIINPHRLKGISLYDKLSQNQDLGTGLKRALMDNANAINKHRTAYLDGKVEPADLEDGRVNNDVRVRGVARVGDAMMTMVPHDLSQGLLANINALKGERAELGGAALELATGNMQLNDRLGSQGLDRAYSVMEQLSALMTKNIANTLIRNTFLLAHATLRENFDEPVKVKPSGKWLTPIPARWVPRDCVSIRIGMSPGERARKAVTLRQMLDDQVALAREGMDDVLVSATGFHRAAMDWGRVSDIPNPEQYYVDPNSDAAREALAKKQQAAAETSQAQQALMAQAIQLEQIRTAMDKYRADQETAFKYWAEVLRAEIEEAKIVGKATAELAKQQREGEQGADDSGTKGRASAADEQQSDDTSESGDGAGASASEGGE